MLECWRKVRVALGPGLVILVTMNDPRLELSGRFHRGPRSTLGWVFIGALFRNYESSKDVKIHTWIPLYLGSKSVFSVISFFSYI